MKSLILVSILFLLIPFTLLSNHYRFRTYDAVDGLSSNTIFNIYQDRKGYIWFGTSEGLNRFDSREFKIFRHRYGDMTSVANNAVRYLFEDADDTFWVGTEDGISIYHQDREEFSDFPFAIGIDTLSNVFVFSIAEDHKRNIWITTLNHGVFRYDKNISVLSQYTHNPGDPGSISSDYVSKVYVDAEGEVWFAASGSWLCKYDPAHDNFERILIKDGQTGAVENNVFAMCGDSFGGIWVAGWGSGIFSYDKRTGIFRNYLNSGRTRLTETRIHIIDEISPGKLLIGCDEGLHFFTPFTGNGNPGREPDAGDTTFGLSDQFIYSVCRDREGGLWIGTYFGGANYSPPNSSNFSVLSKESLDGKIVSKFCEDADGRIFYGTDDAGLFLFDPKKKTIIPVAIDSRKHNLNIHALLIADHYLWVGTYTDGLYKVAIGNKTTAAHYPSFGDGEPQSIYSLYHDQAGQLWIGSKTGIYRYNYGNGSFVSVMELGYNSDILDICEDNEGNIWFASNARGLIFYDQRTRNISFVESAPADSVLMTNQLRSLTFFKNRLWIGTAGNGLLSYDPTGKTVVKAEGLNRYATIYNIIKDNDILWLTTNEGLVKYNIETHQSNVYTQEDGLQAKLFNPNSGIKSSSGAVYLGSGNGFCYFYPQAISENKTVPTLVFTDFRVSNESVSFSGAPGGIDYARQVELSRGQSNFSADFVVLSYCAPHQNRYRYMLDGFDEEWKETGGLNGVTYSNLPPGRYILKVAGCNNDEVWSNIESLSIIVPKPILRSDLMLILYFIILLVTIGAVSKGIKRRHDKEIKNLQDITEKELTEAKINFFTSVAHEIRTPVTLISAPIEEILANDKLPGEVVEDLNVIKDNSDRLIKLVNEILEFRQAEERALQNKKTDISEVTSQTISRFHSSCERSGIQLEFKDGMTGNSNIIIIDPEPYVKILSNLLTNAVKHTRDRIIVELFPETETFALKVTDNGMGIKAEDVDRIFTMFTTASSSHTFPMKSFGIGLSTVDLLAKKMDAAISVESEYGSFASFIVHFNKGRTVADDNNEESPREAEYDAIESLWQSGKETILIVEDNAELLKFFSRLFNKHYKVLTAKDGTEALNLLNCKQIDIVISDVMMPGMDGFELAEKIRANINLSHIPIIMLTAKAGIEDKIAGLESGADIYVEKPVSSTYLLAQVKSLLDKRRIMTDTLKSLPFVPLSSVYTNKTDSDFMRGVASIIDKNISNQKFSVDDLAEATHLSRSVLYEKLRAITDITPNDFIRLIRLRKAAEYLAEGKYRINEICYLVGFNSASYFAKCFHKQFGMLPKDFSAKNSKRSL